MAELPNYSPAQWDALAPTWISRCRTREANREGMLDEWMLRCVGDPAGLRIIDIGCGEGRFCRMLADRAAASIVGVDFCATMIDAARSARATDRERYILGDAQRLDDIPSASFDLAVSYLTLLDVPDLGAAIAAACRVLRAGGRWIVCNLAPMATSANARITEPDGSRIAIRVDHYFDETTREMRVCGGTVWNFHRTLSTYINAFLAEGFTLRGLYEPVPTAESLCQFPEMANELRAPSFIIYDLSR